MSISTRALLSIICILFSLPNLARATLWDGISLSDFDPALPESFLKVFSIPPDHESPLLMAIHQGRFSDVREMISENPQILEQIYSHRRHALIHAVQERNPNLISFLIKAGLSVDHRDEFGHSALFYAAHQDWANGVSLLLEEGANPTQEDRNGNTPLVIAAAAGWTGTVKVLMKNQEVQRDLSKQLTALVYAISQDQSEVVDILLNGLRTNQTFREYPKLLEEGLVYSLNKNSIASALTFLRAGASSLDDTERLPKPIEAFLLLEESKTIDQLQMVRSEHLSDFTGYTPKLKTLLLKLYRERSAIISEKQFNKNRIRKCFDCGANQVETNDNRRGPADCRCFFCSECSRKLIEQARVGQFDSHLNCPSCGGLIQSQYLIQHKVSKSDVLQFLSRKVTFFQSP